MVRVAVHSWQSVLCREVADEMAVGGLIAHGADYADIFPVPSLSHCT